MVSRSFRDWSVASASRRCASSRSCVELAMTPNIGRRAVGFQLTRHRRWGTVTAEFKGNSMRRFALFATILAAFGLLSPADAQTRREPGAAGKTDVSAQSRRPPSRLRVYPGRRLLYRDCTFRLAQQARPDGIFVVPVQRCWWVRG